MKLVNNRIHYGTWLSTSLFVGALVIAAAGCSSDPAEVAGQYSISLTNGENGCGFDPYTVGNSASGIAMKMTQSGSAIEADFGGTVAALVLDSFLGDHVFRGSVDGNDLSLDIVGNVSGSQGNCTWTYNAHASATIDGDVLQGTIDYTAKTNQGTDCGERVDCHTIQTFNGTRPPSN